MEERKITIDGLQINCKIFDQGGFALAKIAVGETVLVLHGWGKGSDSWVNFGKLLAQDGYCAIIPDLPGFGKSQVPEISWTMAEYLKFLERFVFELKMDNFYIAGHSFGGGLAAVFAAHNPKMIKKIVLVDAAIIRKERLGLRQRAAKILAGGKDIFMRLPFADKIKPLAERMVYKIAGNYDYKKTSGAMRQTFKNILSEDLSPTLGFIKMPALIIWGDADKSTPLEDAYSLKDKINGAKLKVIDNCGHNPHVTHTADLAAIIAGFLKK